MTVIGKPQGDERYEFVTLCCRATPSPRTHAAMVDTPAGVFLYGGKAGGFVTICGVSRRSDG
jgi:hypothetical protein